jgi:NADH:ubiquinone oxidoreductase subunit E
MATRHEMIFCMGSSCFARGNGEMLTRVQDFLIANDIKSLKVKGALCCDNCRKGPNILLNNNPLDYNNFEELKQIIQRLDYTHA